MVLPGRQDEHRRHALIQLQDRAQGETNKKERTAAHVARRAFRHLARHLTHTHHLYVVIHFLLIKNLAFGFQMYIYFFVGFFFQSYIFEATCTQKKKKNQ